MKTILRLVALFLALLGCPLRAEIVTDKKVFTPSPTLTLQSMVEEAYGNKVKVRCPTAVHPSLKTLIYVPMGLVLKVDTARYIVRVEEAYPAATVDELDAKIAARLGGKKKGQEVAVQPDRTLTPDPATQPETVLPDPQTPDPKVPEPPSPEMVEEAATFLDHGGVSRTLDLKTVQAVMKRAADTIAGLEQNQQSTAVVGKQRDEAQASNATLAEEIKTLTRERDEAKASLEPEQNKVKMEQALTKAAMIERDQARAQLATANAEKEKALREQKRSYEGERGLLICGAIFLIAVVSWATLGIGRWQGRREERRKTQIDPGDLSPTDLMRTSKRDGVKHELTGTRDANPDAWPHGKIPDPRSVPELPPSMVESPTLATSDLPSRPEKPVRPPPLVPDAPPPLKEGSAVPATQQSTKPIRPIPIPEPDQPPDPTTLKTGLKPFSGPPPEKAKVTVIQLPASEPSSAGCDDDTVIFPPVLSPAPPVVKTTNPPVLQPASTYQIK